MSSDSRRSIFRFAAQFSFGTLLSRLTGMLRDISMAFWFGASASVSLFFLIYRFVYLFRRLFGERLLQQGFIPHFEGSRIASPKEAALLFRDLFWTSAFCLGTVVILGDVFCASKGGEGFRLAARMLPGLLFICLFGLTSSLLYSLKSFYLPAVSPVFFNCIWIVGVITCKALPDKEGVERLALILTWAFALQFAVTLPQVWSYLRRHLSLRELFPKTLFSSRMVEMVKPIFFSLIGIGAIQINSAVDGLFARYSLDQGPALLWYAIRLQQLPFALFGIAIASALFPPMARSFKRRDYSYYQKLVEYGGGQVTTWILPCVIAIFVLGASSVNLLYGRGDFTPFATAQTTFCLWAYGLSLFPAALSQVVVQSFYAKGDYRTPTVGFVCSALSNMLLNALFVLIFHFGVVSIPLATSFASLLNFLYLSKRLQGSLGLRKVIGKVLGVAILSGGGAFFMGRAVGDLSWELMLGRGGFAEDFPSQAVQFFVPASVFFILFFGLCWAFRVEVFPSRTT